MMAHLYAATLQGDDPSVFGALTAVFVVVALFGLLCTFLSYRGLNRD